MRTNLEDYCDVINSFKKMQASNYYFILVKTGCEASC